MWSTGRHALQDLFREFTKTSRSPIQCFSQTTCKNTVVVERWWQVPLSKEGRPPRLYPRRHRVYKVVEDTKHSPKEKMEVILTQTVAKLGGRGDTVFVKKSLGRNKLLDQGLAVYPSPENKHMFAEELRLLHEGKPEERIQTRTGQMTAELLKHMELKVEKKTSVDYEITKEIVCRHFLKRRGLFMPPHALRLPEEPIRELGDYWCEVTVNGIDTVRIPMSVVPWQDRSASHFKMLKQQKEVAAAAAVSEEALSEEALSEARTAAIPEPPAAAVVTEAVMTESLPEAAATASLPEVPAAPEASASPGAAPVPAPEETAAPVLETPAPEETAAAAPVLETPAPEETAAAAPVLETPAPEETAAAAPVLETPAPEETAAPVLETPAPEETAAAAPVLETPAPVLETPAPEETAAAPEAASTAMASPEALATASTPEAASEATKDNAAPSNETQKKD